MAGSVLIAYYSWSGNTRRLAEAIYRLTGGTLFEIVPATPYPADYDETVRQAREEIRRGYKPQLKSRLETIEPFKVVFVGSPNWWGTIAPPVASFLSMYDFSGKVVAPFFSHGGGGLQRMLTAVKQLCPGSTVLDPLVVYEGDVDRAEELVGAWLKRLGIERYLGP
ncbi:MAG: flavodoxin [Thermofilaceae archaeon]